jgi:peptidoglycan/LPS O-acetylase OafA/YrhL
MLAWAISPADTFGHKFDPGISWWHREFYTSIQPNMLAFLTGMIANLYLKRSSINVGMALIAAAALTYISFLPLGISSFASNTVGLIAFAVLVTYLARNGASKIESILGSFTYALYLIHLPVIRITREFIDNSLQATVISAIISLALSLLISIFIEEKIIEHNRRKWLNSWKKGEKQYKFTALKYNAVIFAVLFTSMIYYMNIYTH